MARFLSTEWITLANEAVQRSAELREATTDVEVAIQQHVTGAPGGEIHYVIRVNHGESEVLEGIDESASFSFTQDWETAVAISRGSLAVQDAFAAGKLRVGGNISLMMEVQTAFADLADVFAELREATTY